MDIFHINVYPDLQLVRQRAHSHTPNLVLNLYSLSTLLGVEDNQKSVRGKIGTVGKVS